jgi:hypothetical protein
MVSFSPSECKTACTGFEGVFRSRVAMEEKQCKLYIVRYKIETVSYLSVLVAGKAAMALAYERSGEQKGSQE